MDSREIVSGEEIDPGTGMVYLKVVDKNRLNLEAKALRSPANFWNLLDWSLRIPSSFSVVPLFVRRAESKTVVISFL